MDPQQQAILQQLNRPGWKVTGQRPEVKSVQGPPDAYGQPSKVDTPTGNVVWVITGPGGQSDEVVVKPPTAPNVPYENPADPGAKPGAAGYTVVEGPKNNVQQPQAPAGWSDVKGITNNGVTTYYGRNPANGKFERVPGLPTETATTPAKPTPASGLEIINDPTTGKPIKMRDPSTGTVIDLPNATPVRPTIVDGPNGSKYSWDGEKLTQQLAGTAPDAKPVEGQTRQSVIPGTQYIGQETFHNGVWSIDQSFSPKPYVPSDKPKDGDVRPNTDPKGQAIQEVFRGGSWVTDTSVAPKPFGTQAPTTLNTGTGPYIVQQTPEQAQRGETTNLPNPNTTDVAARVGQLQTAARTKRDQLQQAVTSGTKTAEDAAAEFDTWWAGNVDPFSQQLQRTQQQQDYDAQTKQREQQRLEQEAQRGAYSTAETAGQDAVKNATNFGPGIEQVGPGYGAAMSNILGAFSSGKAPGPIDANSLTWQAPDLNSIARKATAEALAHISPTAATIAGRPMPQIPQSYDVAGALNKSQYTFSGKTTIAPDGTVTIDHSPQGYQGAPNPNVFGSGTGPYVSPAAPQPSPAVAPNEMNLFGNYAYGG